MSKNVLYKEVTEDLKKLLLDGTYPVGTLIPTEDELVEKYQVSKITVRNAVKKLVEEGYLEKKSGHGTTVLSNRLFNKLSKAQSFSSIVEQKGFKLEKKILSIEQIQPSECPVNFALNRLTGVITKVEKLYLLNGEPFIYFKHYFPFYINQSMKSDLESQSLYQIIKETGEIISRFEDKFYGYLLNDEDKIILGDGCDIGIKRIRQSYNESKKLIEYSDSVYLTEKYPYVIDYDI